MSGGHLTSNEETLRAALRVLLDHYVEMVRSGACGNWDPEGEGEVAQARAALRLAGDEPYPCAPSSCGHAQARVICPECGIDMIGRLKHEQS